MTVLSQQWNTCARVHRQSAVITLVWLSWTQRSGCNAYCIHRIPQALTNMGGPIIFILTVFTANNYTYPRWLRFANIASLRTINLSQIKGYGLRFWLWMTYIQLMCDANTAFKLVKLMNDGWSIIISTSSYVTYSSSDVCHCMYNVLYMKSDFKFIGEKIKANYCHNLKKIIYVKIKARQSNFVAFQIVSCRGDSMKVLKFNLQQNLIKTTSQYKFSKITHLIPCNGNRNTDN